jgi:hypothetical protein
MPGTYSIREVLITALLQSSHIGGAASVVLLSWHPQRQAGEHEARRLGYLASLETLHGLTSEQTNTHQTITHQTITHQNERDSIHKTSTSQPERLPMEGPAFFPLELL